MSAAAHSFQISPHVLLVEDDNYLNMQLTERLTAVGYRVTNCFDGTAAMEQIRQQEFHIILLDILLPQIDGLALLNVIRDHSQTPVIMVTAKGAEEERITGFKLGADDYVAKPFNTTELLLRIEALLRRSQAQPEVHTSDQLTIDSLSLDRRQRSAFVSGQAVKLTHTQFDILWILASHHGKTLSKSELSQRVLNKPLGPHDRSLDMHVSRVRRKLNNAQWPGERLKTVHGSGYCLL